MNIAKSLYPVGTRIEVIQMGDDPRPIEPGTKGTVVFVDDVGTVHCDFDNGRRLGLIPEKTASESSSVLMIVDNPRLYGVY